MSTQLTLQRSGTIYQSADEIFAYLSDTSRVQDWRADVVESAASPAGPIEPGTVLREVTLVVGRRIEAETIVDTVTPGRGFSFRHRSGALGLSGEYTCTPLSVGTEVTWTLHLDPHGNWAMFAPYLRRLYTRTMAQSFATLRANLESVPTVRELSRI